MLIYVSSLIGFLHKKWQQVFFTILKVIQLKFILKIEKKKTNQVKKLAMFKDEYVSEVHSNQ